MDSTGKAIVDHWGWVAEKGLMNKNYALSLRNACTKVLGYLDDWENVDVLALDVEDTLVRFQNLAAKGITPDSLRAYQRRFRTAVEFFKDYLKNPSTWKPPIDATKSKSAKSRNNQKKPSGASQKGMEEPRIPSMNPGAVGGLVDYPFPLREDTVITLRLPKDLRLSEVKRITAFMKLLTVDYEVEEE